MCDGGPSVCQLLHETHRNGSALHVATDYGALMRRTSFTNMNCSIAQSLEVVGEWWTPLVLRDAFMGVTRFEQFQSRLGIARNVLAQRLDGLVAAGVMRQVEYQQRPVRHEYVLTPMGRDLWFALMALRQWGDTWLSPDGPPVEAVHSVCAHVTQALPTCSECGAVLELEALRLQPGPGARNGGVLPGGAR